jgi:magnesium-transporting ATPase (P-type)
MMNNVLFGYELFHLNNVQANVERLALLEFSRDRKMMSVLVKGGDKLHTIWSKVRFAVMHIHAHRLSCPR